MTPIDFYGLGSVVALTDAAGAVVEKYEYDVYGNIVIRDTQDAILNTSQIGNPYMFTGRRFDEETELYYYRARHYSPIFGRFLQTDPIGYYDSMNLYQYCGNDPVNWVDPWGLWIVNLTGFGGIAGIAGLDIGSLVNPGFDMGGFGGKSGIDLGDIGRPTGDGSVKRGKCDKGKKGNKGEKGRRGDGQKGEKKGGKKRPRPEDKKHGNKGGDEVKEGKRRKPHPQEIEDWFEGNKGPFDAKNPVWGDLPGFPQF